MIRALPTATCLLAAVSLAACATPRDRVSTALIDAGVQQSPAECFAADVTSRLIPSHALASREAV